MSVPDLLKAIGERLQAGATVKNVFGEPIAAGDRTVVPVARIAWAFGGGGGSRGGESQEGGGGGGERMSAIPAGAIEITPTGTRFVAFLDWRKLASVIAVSAAAGFLMGARRGRS